MICDEIITNSTSGKLILPFDTLSLVIAFIESKLSNFQPKVRRFTENGITQELFIKYLSESELPFYFDKEHLTNIESGNSPSVDIAAILHANKECFLHIEAKRINQNKKDRKKEYLFGKHGAVQRFKLGIHGCEINKGVPFYLNNSAIIGYLVNPLEDFDYWHKCINSWIDEQQIIGNDLELIWDCNDRLIEKECINSVKVRKFFSNPKRINRSSLNLYHLWVKLNIGS